jgi:filamentous hemagglutinin
VATAAAWDEGGTDRTLAHIAGGALIGGLGGGRAFSTIGGVAGAGFASKAAPGLADIANGVSSATGSAVQFYNQNLDKRRKDLVSQVCGAGAQCSDATLSAVIGT